jgi:hypothetical protein
MSDQTINQLRASLKVLNERIEKLAKAINELEMIAYRYHRLSYEINQIDVAAFAVRQEFEQVREACQRVNGRG